MLILTIACAAVVVTLIVLLFTAWAIDRDRAAEDEREATAYYSGTANEWLESILPPAPAESLIERYDRLFGPGSRPVLLALPAAPSSSEAAAQ